MAQRYEGADPSVVPANALTGKGDRDLPGGLGPEDTTSIYPDAPANQGRKGGAIYATPHAGAPGFGGGAAVVEPFPAADRQAIRPHSDETALAAAPAWREDEIVDADGEIVHPFVPQYGRAAFAGVAATAALLAMWAPLPFLFNELSLDIPWVLGTALVGNAPRAAAQIVGGVLALLFGALAGMTYAWFTAGSRVPSNARNGFWFGLATGLGVLTLGYPTLIGLIARFAPGHPFHEMPDLFLNRVGVGTGAGGGEAAWFVGLSAFGMYCVWGILLGVLYRHRLSPRVARQAVSGAAPFGY